MQIGAKSYSCATWVVIGNVGVPREIYHFRTGTPGYRQESHRAVNTEAAGAYARMLRGDVKYRFVIDISTLGNS